MESGIDDEIGTADLAVVVGELDVGQHGGLLVGRESAALHALADLLVQLGFAGLQGFLGDIDHDGVHAVIREDLGEDVRQAG